MMLLGCPARWMVRCSRQYDNPPLRNVRRRANLTRRETYVGAWIPEPLPDPAEWSSGQPGDPAAPSGLPPASLLSAARLPIEGGEQVARCLADLARAATGNVTLPMTMRPAHA